MIHVILPAYNEEASLPRLLPRLEGLQQNSGTRIVTWVVDDGSTDKTSKIARTGVPGLDVRLVSHGMNLGLGSALMTGIASVLEGADADDVIVVMDADDTHDVNLILSMVSEIDRGADMVIASRFVPGGNDNTAPVFRRFLSRCAALTFRTILPVGNVRDFTSGYRAYKAGLLRHARIEWGDRLIEERGFACMVELLLKLRHLDPVIREVPLVLRYDRKGSISKLKLGKTLMQYLKLTLGSLLKKPAKNASKAR